MSRDEMLKSNYEDALFALLMNSIAEEEGKALLEENERLMDDPDAELPERLDRRCRAAIKRAFAKQDRRSVVSVTARVFSKVAVAASVAMLLFGTAYASFPEVRVRTLNLLIEVSDVSTSLTFGEKNDMSPTNRNSQYTDYTLLGYQIPQLPSDFVVIHEEQTMQSATIEFSNGTEASIVFRVLIGSNASYSVDTEDADSMNNIRIHEFDGLLVCKAERVQLVWGDTENELFIEVLSYGVDSAYVVNIAESMIFSEIKPN